MKRIDIKINFKCNNCCKFCVQGDKRHWCVDKTTNEIKDILEDSRKGYDEVVFTGGEPTIRPDIIDLVAYAKNLDYRILIQSNGRMFAYKDFCESLVNAGARQFALSIHGHKAELHDFLTGVKGSFKQTVAGIENLSSYLSLFGNLIATNTVITNLNYRFLPDISKLLISLGIREYQFAFPHILGSAEFNQKWLIPSKKKIAPYVRKGLEIGIKNKRRVRVEAIPYCFLKGYEDCVSDKSIPDTKVFDIHLTNSFENWRKNVGKSKGKACRSCKFFECCEGPWREYPEIYGWSEFKPVK